MNRFLIPVFLLLPFHSPAQKEIETYYDFGWRQTAPEDASFYGVIKRTDSGWYRQIEYIHANSYYLQGLYQDGDGVIPHGYNRTFYTSGNLKAFGKYVRGRRVGLWLAYYDNGKLSDSIWYNDGRPQILKRWFPNGVMSDSIILDEDGNGDAATWSDNGRLSSSGRVAKFYMHADQWKYYHKNGKMAAYITYNSRTDKIIDGRYFNESGMEGRSVKDREAAFPGGSAAWNGYLEKNVVMPEGFFLEGARKATIVIHAFINEDGRITGAYVKVPLHPSFDEAVLKAVNASPDWIPATHHNRKVYDEIDVPFTFIQKGKSRQE